MNRKFDGLHTEVACLKTSMTALNDKVDKGFATLQTELDEMRKGVEKLIEVVCKTGGSNEKFAAGTEVPEVIYFLFNHVEICHFLFDIVLTVYCSIHCIRVTTSLIQPTMWTIQLISEMMKQRMRVLNPINACSLLFTVLPLPWRISRVPQVIRVSKLLKKKHSA